MNDQRLPRGLTVCQQAKVFEPFRLDMVNLCLWRAKERMHLAPKAFDILRYLVERADRLVTHDELLEALWPEAYVNPEGIRKYILEIRKVLGDRPRHPLFIATLPKRGYRFVAKVADGRVSPPSGAEIAGDDGECRPLSEALGSLRRALNSGIAPPAVPEQSGKTPAVANVIRDRSNQWVAVAVYSKPLSSPFERCQESQPETWAAFGQELPKRDR